MSRVPITSRIGYLCERVQGGAGCWTWTGSLSHEGYGRANDASGKRVPAHRFVWELLIGSLGTGDLHHDCGNRACVNPDHLRLLTKAEHKRLHCAEVTHCPRGHAYTEENTYLGSGRFRSCRTCHRERERERYHARKAMA